MSLISFKSYDDAAEYMKGISFEAYGADVEAQPDLPKKITALFLERFRQVKPNYSEALLVYKVILLVKSIKLAIICDLIHQTLSILIQNGADLHGTDDRGHTPLHLMAAYGGPVFLLIEKGVNVNSKDNNNLTPLYLACRNRKFFEASKLLRAGATITLEDTSMLSELFKATNFGINDKFDDGLTLLQRACKHQEYDAVFHLIEMGATITSEVLMLVPKAASRGKTLALLKLLEKGADIDAKDEDGLTLLQSASKNKHMQTAIYLLEQGATFTSEDKEVLALVHAAAARGKTEILFKLVKNGADIDARDNEGRTPLHWAAGEGRVETVRLLIEKGADIDAKDNKGETPLQRASIIRRYESVRVLFENGAAFRKEDVIYLLDPHEQLDCLGNLTPEEKKLWTQGPNPLPPLAIAILAQDERDFIQKIDIKSLSQEQVRVLIPHMDLNYWQIFFRPYKHNLNKSREILSFSLPSQIETLETQDLVVDDYYILETKLDKIAKELRKAPANEALKKRFSNCNLLIVREEQIARDDWMKETFQNPKLFRQREVYESKRIKCAETLDAIEKKYEDLKKAFEEAPIDSLNVTFANGLLL